MNQTAIKELRESKIVKIIADGRVMEQATLTPNGDKTEVSGDMFSGTLYNAKTDELITLAGMKAHRVYHGTLEVSNYNHKSYSIK